MLGPWSEDVFELSLSLSTGMASLPCRVTYVLGLCPRMRISVLLHGHAKGEGM